MRGVGVTAKSIILEISTKTADQKMPIFTQVHERCVKSASGERYFGHKYDLAGSMRSCALGHL